MRTHGRRLGLVVILMAMLTSGCVAATGATSAPGTSGLRPVPTGPFPTASDIDPAGTAVAPGPYTPNEFWFQMGGGVDMVGTYDSLSSLAKTADLVVVGTLERFEKGPVLKLTSQGDLAYTYRLTVNVASTVKGNVISPSSQPGVVMVNAIHGLTWDETRYKVDQASAPIGDRVVLFLRNLVADAARRGSPTGDIGGGAEVYAMLNGSDAWIRDNHGVAQVYVGEGSPAWMTSTVGRPFDEIVHAVVAAAASK